MTISLHPQECLLCCSSRADQLLVFHEPDPYEMAVGVKAGGYERAWVKCRDCGFIYSRYSRAPECLDAIYRSSYRREGAAWRNGKVEEIFERVIRLPAAESETKARVLWIKSRIAELASSGLIREKNALCNFLDVGGGNGIFAYEFQDERWKAHVVDPDDNGLFIQSKHGIPFVQGAYRSGLFAETFDLISLVFVLEHVRRPDLLLQDVRRDMGTEGLLYIEVPDSVCFKVKDHGDDIFNACHLWMFSPGTLTKILDMCGLEVVALQRGRTKRGHMALTVLAGVKS